ncbi:ribonuclease Z [Candidatus Woesearchaeota archaeon]|nr:ribonuclease Z [Candidatus Woesearchaeota archaeon]
MEVVFLGTSSMVPTKERNHTSIFLSYKGEGILLDCGEGTQRQMKIAGIRPTQVSKILISHWHGDHVLGIPGIIQTLGANEYSGTLEIYGPEGTKKHIDAMFEAFVFEQRIKLVVKEIKPGKFLDAKDYYLECAELKHSTMTLGFSFTEKDRRRINVKYVKKQGIPEGPLLGKLQENKSITWKGKKISPKEATYIVKGKKIAYIADTVPTRSAVELAEDADLMICESTFASEHEKKGEEYMHMTAKQAGLLANQAQAKKLVLTHFSQRYKNTSEIEEDARTVFDNVVCAEDLMRFRL